MRTGKGKGKGKGRFGLYLYLSLYLSSASAAITFGVATAAGTTSADGRTGPGALAVTLPTNWAVGQLAILLVYVDSGASSTPTNWTSATGNPFGPATTSTPKFYIYYKFLATSEPNPSTTISGNDAGASTCGAIMTYNGVDATTPVAVIGADSAGTGTPMVAYSVTPLVTNSWAVGCCGRGDNEAASGEAFGGSTTGVTERLDAGTNAGDDSQVSGYSKEISGTAASGEGTSVTSITDPWVSLVIILKPLPVTTAPGFFF